MVEIGDLVACPRCGKKSKVVWISKDAETAGVRCSSWHVFGPKRNFHSPFTKKEVDRTEKNIVFMVKI
jgi:hypothetical protein